MNTNMDTAPKYILTWYVNSEIKQAIFEDRELAESYYETKLAENKIPALYEYTATLVAYNGVNYGA